MHGLTGAFADAMGKMPGTLLRLASAIAHLHWAAAPDEPEPDMIGGEVVAHAIRLLDRWLVPHLRRCYGQAGTPRADAQAQALAAWIMRTGAEGLNAHALRRSGDIPELREAAAMDAACAALVEGGWMRAIGGRAGDTAGRQRKEFQVSPVV